MKLFCVLILTLLMASAAAAQQGAGIPAQLVGKWFNGSASILGEQNMTTGALASKYGSSIGYYIEADGAFIYAGLIKSTMYGCTSSLWNEQRGKISVAADVITFTPSKDYWFSSNSCYPSANREKNKPLETHSYNFEVGERQGKTWLCMREVGKTRVEDIICYPRAND